MCDMRRCRVGSGRNTATSITYTALIADTWQLQTGTGLSQVNYKMHTPLLPQFGCVASVSSSNLWSKFRYLFYIHAHIMYSKTLWTLVQGLTKYTLCTCTHKTRVRIMHSYIYIYEVPACAFFTSFTHTRKTVKTTILKMWISKTLHSSSDTTAHNELASFHTRSKIWRSCFL